MFQIHIVDRSNQCDYQIHLEQHFRLRHKIYVDERGWHDLARPDGREVDEFDTEDATYLLAITPGEGVVAGSRLLPSLKPHLMSEVFPQLAPSGVPKADDIYEWTRIFVVSALREPGYPCVAAGAVYCGILEYCLRHRIRHLSIVCETYWFDRLARLGWNPRSLGPSLVHREETIIGLIVDMSPAALETTRRAYAIDGSVLWWKSISESEGEEAAQLRAETCNGLSQARG
ncbi:acyl-homoserine-lactone synthase [Roseibium aggregatum]|uniref:Acyl-homoserine-lactone synthase n=1 Tax=Roseibium aggregatum TaxID=187304 RepID=A0A926S9Y2_9HYPH|nr:acyl-homoserine-lactone synthase [Roseibium aggregatum]MBD1547809.1 GNAT family N-acetyltransferase [Roseibium aggregatum]